MWFKRKPFQVKLTGRAGIVYREGDRSMQVDSEMLVGPRFDMVVFTDSIKAWEPPDECVPVSEEDKARIRANITKELNNLRIDWQ
jgi:hypothetical protein